MDRSQGREEASRRLLRRRDFLAFGSAGFASLYLADLAWAAPPADAGVLPLPVAYLEGSDQISDLKHLPRSIRRPATGATPKSIAEEPLQVVAAERLPLGDTSLIGRPLRMRVHGLYPPAAQNPQRRKELPLAIDLDVVFPPPDPVFPERVPFYAWSFRRRPGWNPSPPVSFVFPLDWYVYPELAVKVIPANGGTPFAMGTRFTLDDESGLPRLRRGLYLLGLRPGAWTADMPLPKLGGSTPAELFAVLISLEPEGEEP